MVSRSVIMKKVWAGRSKAEKGRLMGKIRKKWTGMSPRARRKVMPMRITTQKVKELKAKGKYYPVGSWITKDVGKPRGHYIVTKKTKYGWTPARLIRYADLKKKIAKARKKWVALPPELRKRKKIKT